MSLQRIIDDTSISPDLRTIAGKVKKAERLSPEEGLILFEKGDPGFLGVLANHIREKLHGDITYFNRNFHIEPTNICIFTCKFCSYSRMIKNREDGWIYTEEEIMNKVRAYDSKPVTEVHIVGGVYPKLDLKFFSNVLKRIKAHRPELHIKGFTAVELEYMFKKDKVTVDEGLKILKDSGLDSLPGGGAEIFHPEVRSQICDDKVTAENWLNIHETAHKAGLKSNATMLYGHVEKYEHRIHHMDELRKLQDRTGGFNTFIPLKFRSMDNEFTHLGEVAVVEDLKTYAVSRIFMDNFAHVKAYWPMIGRSTAQLSLAFGVNDIDGTIDDTTKIYSMAGAEEQSPVMTTTEIVQLIKGAKRSPVERDTLYNVIKDYSEIDLIEEEIIAN